MLENSADAAIARTVDVDFMAPSHWSCWLQVTLTHARSTGSAAAARLRLRQCRVSAAVTFTH
jgi:hypothetical protein